LTTLLTPFAYPITLGTVSALIVPQNPSRKALLFINPSATASVSFCPALTASGVALAAVLNGAGSFTLFPGGMLPLPGDLKLDNLGLGAAWNAIASAPGTPFTVWEF
jgi:hypothetical protein